jgi:pyruvate/2-oxoglutarate dehydrogenase complex dihydrolipoamide acyltransferase (E2) component
LATVTFNILVGVVNKRSKNIRFDATGAGDVHEAGRSIKYSEAITAGGTITITTTGTVGGTWTVDSLRVYGVI